jgi:hypothetical protein
MLVASRRQRRRRPWLLLAVLVTFVVLAVNAAMSARSPGPSRKLAQLAYLDRVRPQVQRSTEQAGEVADVRARAVTLGRDGVSRRMERVAREAGRVQQTMLDVSPPRSLRVAHGLLVSTAAVRARATTALRDAIGTALGPGPPDAAVRAMMGAGADLMTADRAYLLFLDSLPSNVRAQSTMPVSQWVPDPQLWQEADVAGFVSTLRSSATLAPVHDLSLLFVTTDPTPVATDGHTALLPATIAITVRLVVANVGNEIERHAAVTAQLGGSPGRGPEVVRSFVDLSPGQRLATTLAGLHPQAGTVYTLTVRVATVDGETNVSDNEQSMLVQVKQ